MQNYSEMSIEEIGKILRKINIEIGTAKREIKRLCGIYSIDEVILKNIDIEIKNREKKVNEINNEISGLRREINDDLEELQHELGKRGRGYL